MKCGADKSSKKPLSPARSHWTTGDQSLPPKSKLWLVASREQRLRKLPRNGAIRVIRISISFQFIAIDSDLEDDV